MRTLCDVIERLPSGRGNEDATVAVCLSRRRMRVWVWPFSYVLYRFMFIMVWLAYTNCIAVRSCFMATLFFPSSGHFGCTTTLQLLGAVRLLCIDYCDMTMSYYAFMNIWRYAIPFTSRVCVSFENWCSSQFPTRSQAAIQFVPVSANRRLYNNHDSNEIDEIDCVAKAW
ncbi:hypothetical protein BKA70DRAFT_4248 [Coprinopsis sp. MPI-PUGE-AT-0042]|nr:hypothetical protein BKA70DRAFT_4248 [Coprinopsis sp. MPI-PUGE-AT-0042]